MKPRPYQQEFIDAVEKDFADGHKRVMGVAAGGAGKSMMVGTLMDREQGNCLFLADQRNLVEQNAGAYYRVSGEMPGIEMAEHSADPGFDRVIIASMQTMANRLDRYEPDHFNFIAVDEAHKCSLGDQAQDVLNHFETAKILGVTATPFRSDRKQLGDYYEKISIEIGLDRLIKEGYLSRIMIKSIPMTIDLSQVGSSGGDYSTSDLGEAVEPILREAAKLIKEHAKDRKKIVVFLPLVKTSIRFARICNEMGLDAVHVSGEDKADLERFVDGPARVICNAMLLTTGWDFPAVDCVMSLRPTKSLALYQQSLLRGSRLSPGKENLLVLDPLYLADDHNLISPARLVARDQAQADAMMEAIHESGEEGDLMEIDSNVEEERNEALRKRIEENAKKKLRLVDAMEFTLDTDPESVSYDPEFAWESAPASEKQIAALAKAGFDTDDITGRGHASKILDILFRRRAQGLATPKQLRLLKRFKHPMPAEASFDEASAYIDSKMGGNKAPPIKATTLLALKRAGLRPSEYRSEAEAKTALDAA